MKELCHFAFQLGEKNKLNHNFNKDSQMAGLDWSRSFMKLHRELCLRKPEVTLGFNKVAVTRFFNLLTKIVDAHHLNEDIIYNYDETECQRSLLLEDKDR